MEKTESEVREEILSQKYKYGFVTDIEVDQIPMGLSEDTVRQISKKKNEPQWLLDFRLKAYAKWLTMEEPHWPDFDYDPIDYQKIIYYSAAKVDENAPKTLDDVDPELIKTFEKLGIPLEERERLAGIAVDAVFDSASVKTTHQDALSERGIIFCSFSEAVQNHPSLVKKYLASVVPIGDNFFAALNSAVFSDGSFVYIPKGVKCPMDLSTYFRINAENTGQFERTLIIADEGSYVSYLEGCTAPQRDENQLHAAIVELIALKDSEIKYSTVQNWYSGDEEGRGGIYNFVTKRAICKGDNSKVSWTQVEAGSALTWKYPSVILKGDNTIGEFYSVALTNNKMMADTGTKMIHIGRNSRSKIISKGISAEQSRNSYRGLVKIMPSAHNAKNYSQCDSLLVGDKCYANTFPYIENKNSTSVIEHEATTSRISEKQIFYLRSRGLDMDAAISLIINGFAKDVFNELPLEFSEEAVRLLEMKLEGSVG